MIKKILYLLLAIIALYLAFCAMSPKNYHFKVTKTISATPERVFEQIGDYKNWDNWSAWHKRDPEMKKVYGATTSGLGASYSWTSPNKESGTGSQEMTVFVPNQKVTSKVYFKDFDSYMNATMELKDKNGSTEVTWAYDDIEDVPFYFRGFMKLMGMEKGITKDYNEGLDNLEAYLKANPAAGMPPSTPPVVK